MGNCPPAEEAQRFVALAGGAGTVLSAAQAAAEDDPQWAMQLADRLIVLAGDEAAGARAVKAGVLRLLADRTLNAPTRNYYLLSAQELEAL